MLEPPEVWGVEDFGPAGITIRLVIKTRPSAQFGLMRELRGRLKAALDEAGMPMAFEQAMRIQVREGSEALPLPGSPGSSESRRIPRVPDPEPA